MVKAQLRTLSTLMLCGLLLSACGDQGQDKKPSSQVAAKVNGGEVSVHQVNFMLQRTPGVTPEKAAEAKRQILDSLVDQELAVQQAVEAKLDRDPRVMQTLEAARREILARAYLEQAVAEKSKPTADEVKAYYKDHPELFANRKIYRLQEISFPGSPETVAAVKEELARARNGQDLLAALKARGIEVTGGITVKPAEKIAMEMLPKLARMQPGQSGLFEGPKQAAIVTVLAATPEPVDEARAKPFIEQFLNRREAGELARETMHQLREKASIEYLGEFSGEAEAARKQRDAEEARKIKEAREAREAARIAQENEAAQRAEAARKAREAAAAQAPAPGKVAPPPEGSLNKGIAGLK